MGSVWFSGFGDVFSGDEERRTASADRSLLVSTSRKRTLSAHLFSYRRGLFFELCLTFIHSKGWTDPNVRQPLVLVALSECW